MFLGEFFDFFDDVDDGAAGANADVGVSRGEVVGDGAAGGVAFGGFDVDHLFLGAMDGRGEKREENSGTMDKGETRRSENAADCVSGLVRAGYLREYLSIREVAEDSWGFRIQEAHGN